MIIPIYMAAATEPVNDENRVSYILVQVKNWLNLPSSSEREGLVGRHLKGDGLPTRPYLSRLTVKRPSPDELVGNEMSHPEGTGERYWPCSYSLSPETPV